MCDTNGEIDSVVVSAGNVNVKLPCASFSNTAICANEDTEKLGELVAAVMQRVGAVSDQERPQLLTMKVIRFSLQLMVILFVLLVSHARSVGLKVVCSEAIEPSQMAMQLTPIKNINSSTRNWTAKVKVLEKWSPSQHSPVKLQKLILADAEGSRVQATIIEDDIEKLEDTLQFYNTYLISNAGVKYVSPKYRLDKFKWQWTINARTLIQTVDESLSHENLLNLHFVPFEQIEHSGGQTTIDILAAVARVQPPKVLSKPGNPIAQEIILINQELKPIILTFWDDFITREGKLLQNTSPYPVLIGIHVRVSTYNGHSLSSRPRSSFVIDPDTMTAHTLKAWCIANKETVEQLCDEFLAKPILRIVPNPNDKDIICITDVPKTLEMVEKQMYWIQGKISIVSLNQNFWLMACPNCRKSISARDEVIFDCFNCNRKKVLAKPSWKFEVLLTDASGSMTAIMFEENAEEYFLVDGKKTHEICCRDQNVIAVFPKLALENEYRIQLKPREYPSRGVKVLAYNIGSIKPAVTEDKANEDPLTETGKYSSAASEVTFESPKLQLSEHAKTSTN
ncbi:hypothetical protein RHGRI_022836 [Rhododendron griersonianum]|uniref:Replication factor A C-terminal domain-containing protein n=1 Tax=Rhododendron griersonianum TaxID=479676 RepID=A0AAV6J866_9ERIC|nr:hypothetical protein RHGRI_022836 [Rhododendron griersonianum]